MNENNEVDYDDGYDLILPIEFSYYQPLFWGSQKVCAYHAVKFTRDFGPFRKNSVYKNIELNFDGNKGEVNSTHFDKAKGPYFRFTKTSMDDTAYIRESNTSTAAKSLLEDYKSPELNTTLGLKESESKLEYELDFEFIRAMAERMATNKGKYPPYNWKKPMDVDKLKQALFRHTVEVMSGKHTDDNREYGHLEAIACNVMMIMYQLKNHKQ